MTERVVCDVRGRHHVRSYHRCMRERFSILEALQMIGAVVLVVGVWIIAFSAFGWLLLLLVPKIGSRWTARFIEATGLDFQNRPLSVIALAVALMVVGWGIAWLTGRYAMGARKG